MPGETLVNKLPSSTERKLVGGAGNEAMLLIETRGAVACAKIGDRLWIAGRATARCGRAAVVERFAIGVTDERRQAMGVALVVITLEAVIVRRVNRIFLGPRGDVIERLDEPPKGCRGWASGLDQTDFIRVVEIDKMDVVAARIGQFYDAAQGLALNSKA